MLRAGAPLAGQPVATKGRRRPTWRDRLRGHDGMPEFLPVELPVPEVGQQVRLECYLTVMADYDLKEIWTGPAVAAEYRVDRIDALIVAPQGLPEGKDEFDDLPDPPSRIVTDLSTTQPPQDLVQFDTADDGQVSGEIVSAYRLVLTPVGR